MSRSLWIVVCILGLLFLVGNLALVGVMTGLKPEAGPLTLHTPEHPEGESPYLSTPPAVVDAMLRVADVKPGEIVYDLGCGDARILVAAARDFGALGVGIELDDEVFELAVENVRRNQLEDRVKLVHGNMFEADIRQADVVALYLLPQALERLRPILERQLKPGARVVSHDFRMPGWQSVHVEKIPRGNGTSHTVHLYRR